MDIKRCAICGTKEAWHPGNKLRLLYFKFPLDQNICREWVKVVGNEELVLVPIRKLHELRSVCENHFAEKDFNKKGNRLKRHAIPTLNLNASPLTDEQLAKFPQYMYRHSGLKGKFNIECYPPATEQSENIQDMPDVCD